jgi:preprotein translocase subunit SecF
MNIINNRKIFYTISGTLILVSIFLILFFGFRLGIDLVGGTVWQFKTENKDISEEAVGEIFRNSDIISFNIYRGDSESFIFRGETLREEKHVELLSRLKEKVGNIEESRFESIGPSVGEDLRRKAIWAIALVLFGISLYVAFVFRHASYPLKSWRYGIVTVVTLFHDVIIPAGVVALLGKILFIELDTNFIVALLVIMGFSVHDTIVVFDRIRESILNEKASKKKEDFESIVSRSVRETMPRSINTSLTLILVLLALYFFGPENLKYFILTILIGTIAGTYSSICIASPLLVSWYKRIKV